MLISAVLISSNMNEHVGQDYSQPGRAVVKLLWAIKTFIACSKMTGVADRANETAVG
jgi:hypothetical protein